MTLQLFAHPFSSYCQKVLIALYENGIAFEMRMLDPDHAENLLAFAELWPIGKFPVLLDGDHPVMEATVIIEYLARRHPGPVDLVPDDVATALEVRMLDRVFDNHVMTPMQRIVADAMRPEGNRDPIGVADARALLEKSYPWLDGRIGGGPWSTGEAFTLADCAAAPSLFYADWVHPIDARYENLRTYRAGLLARPSVARAVDEARPYRSFFPPGAPDRD